jgi:hypothetical protein
MFSFQRRGKSSITGLAPIELAQKAQLAKLAKITNHPVCAVKERPFY